MHYNLLVQYTKHCQLKIHIRFCTKIKTYNYMTDGGLIFLP